MKVAIAGYDTEGKVSYDYFTAQGHEITICDKNPDLAVPEGAVAVLGPEYLDDLDRFDIIVRTPGLKPSQILEKNPAVADKITSGTNEFFKASPTKNIIGVTGTKGKGTTSTLITKILEAAGNKVHLGGNIGVPALRLLPEMSGDDWVVLELSSFQLIDCKYSPNVAVCLMVVPEHLDWHADMAEYLDAKRQLFAHQTNEDLAVYNACSENSIEIVRSSPGVKAWYQTRPLDHLVGLSQEPDMGVQVQNGRIVAGSTDICGVEEIALIGQHNWENVCAAIAAIWEIINGDITAIRQVVTTFSGLPYRLEFRAEKDGIRYYNDSFATGPGSAMAAIDSITGMKIMIMGGYERGLDLTELCKKLVSSAGHIRTVVIIGASGDRLAKELKNNGFTNFTRSDVSNMQDILAHAREFAQPGDAIVLSPAFASFDMFKNFEDRGQKFNQAVEGL